MNLLTRYCQTARRQPKKLALITEANQFNYDEILQLVQILDLELISRGIRPGQTIVVELDRPELLIALSFLVSLRGLTMIFSSCEVVVANGVAFDAVISTKPITKAPEGCRQIQVEPSWFAPMGTLARPDYTRAVGGGTFVFQSSGSTGQPKLIAISDDDRLTELDRFPTFEGQNRGLRRFMSTIGAATSVAMSVIQDTLLEGGSVALLAEDKDKVLQYIDLWRVDTLLIAPAMAEKILAMPNPHQYMSSLRQIMVTGANSSSTLQRALAAVSGAEIWFGYGSAETGAICRGVLRVDAPTPDSYVGEIARDDLEIAFLDDDLRPVVGATSGILAVRPKEGRPFTRRYMGSGTLNDTIAKTQVQGWHVTGDIMRREVNSLYFVGRVKNVVNLGGRKVSLELIEASLTQHFVGIRFVAVARVSSSGHDELVIFAEGDDPLELAAINLCLSQSLDGITASDCKSVRSFPMTPSSKIDRRALAQMV